VFTLLQKCWDGASECGGTTAVVSGRAANIVNISTVGVADFNCGEQYTFLEDLYYSTNGAGWHHKNKWLNGDPTFDGWHGIEAICYVGAACCKVTALLLDHNNLLGWCLQRAYAFYCDDVLL
jgi:hypothetical protein